MRPVLRGLLLAAAALVLASCSSGGSHPSPSTGSTTAASSSAAAPSSPAAARPRWQHIVVAVLENKSSSQIVGDSNAPYLNALMGQGLRFTDLHAETHPSEPNYMALFSGSTQGLTDDSCPHAYPADNLAAQLRAAGRTFLGYAESLPEPGWTGCDAYPYARRHVPWVSFADVGPGVNQPLSAMPTDFENLPDVSFVIPDVRDDMHDGTIAEGDAWVRKHLSAYATWARTHDSVLIVTWDEDDGSPVNHVATFAVGDGIASGTWTKPASHYTLLRAIEDAFRLPPLGHAAGAAAVPALG